ncbi:SET domain-containing protein [Heterostelium album PN500]|uniref:SET domain-containing protein n=1 Tax=Heterostelium pallidum (strain ATCC 26659 / Pp 5 / PN500) TaxID=670386 RepID=D3B6G5_HETP5|nr:SET domain-containing protein [Heterostelium album PN500]EFA82935.1 SET domain-containing protein [Heterostelium album PN500]|eukprot:XP_020435052.1 SET domain-containing protein [Heterostelium album PN500]
MDYKFIESESSIELVSSVDKGRYILSKDAKKRNEVIFTVEHPYCFAFEPYLVKQVCSVCFAYLETRKQLANNKQKQYIACTGCDKVFYCSQRCYQQGHHSQRNESNRFIDITSPHQHYHTTLECLILRNLQQPAGLAFHHITELNMIINYLSLTPYIKLVNNNNNNNNNNNENNSNSNSNTIIKDRMSVLVGGFDNIVNKDDKKLIRRMTGIVKKAFSNVNYEVEESDILELLTMSTRNCFGLWKNYEECFGLAIYLEASLFNHSCYPNAARVQRGRSIDIIAIRDIEPNEEICISYLNITNGSHERKDHLKNNYLFDCVCIRCTQTNPDIENIVRSFICRNPRVKCSGYLYLPQGSDSRQCNFCQWKESSEIKRIILNSINNVKPNSFTNESKLPLNDSSPYTPTDEKTNNVATRFLPERE